MAIRTISNAGGNYNAVGTWVEGVVPTSADAVVATVTSGQLTVTATASAGSVDLTNYTNTLTINNNVQLNLYGNIILGTGMTVSCVGNGRIGTLATSNLTSNGVTWNGTIYLQGTSAPATFIDSWNITGTLLLNNTASVVTLNADITVLNLSISNNNSLVNTLTGNKIYVNGSLTEATSVVKNCTTEIVLQGTGTWLNSSTGILRAPLTINTSGTITISGNIRYNGSTLTYITGTVITTGSSLIIILSTNLDTDGIIWNNVNIQGSNTTTLISNLSCTGTLTLGSGANTTINGNNIYASGSVIHISSSSFSTSGTTTIHLVGTGTFSSTSTGSLKNNIIINTSGTITLGTTINYNTGTFTYVAGTINAGSNTLNIISTTTIDTSGMAWNNIKISAAIITLNSKLTVSGTLTVATLGNVTITSNYFTCNSLVFGETSNIARTLTLEAGFTYTINSNLIASVFANGARGIIQSSVTSSPVYLILSHGASANVGFVDAIDVDSRGGKTIKSFVGTLTRSENWQGLTSQLGTANAAF